MTWGSDLSDRVYINTGSVGVGLSLEWPDPFIIPTQTYLSPCTPKGRWAQCFLIEYRYHRKIILIIPPAPDGLIESGASDYMTKDTAFFFSIRVRVASGMANRVTRIGQINITHYLTLHDVRRYPHFDYKILSSLIFIWTKLLL